MEQVRNSDPATVLYDITEAVQDGENDIRIEVATTLERERGANKENRHRLGFIVR